MLVKIKLLKKVRTLIYSVKIAQKKLNNWYYEYLLILI